MSRWNRKPVRIARASRSGVVCGSVEVADTFMGRLVGLLGRSELPSGAGLWLHPSSGVHTFGMRFPIDVVALDAQSKVVGLYRNLGPWKVAATKAKIRSVLELPAGQIDASGVTLGEMLSLEERLVPQQPQAGEAEA